MKVLPCIFVLALLAGCQTVTRTPVPPGWVESVEFRGISENTLLAERVIRTANEYYSKIPAMLGDSPKSLRPIRIVFVDSVKSRKGDAKGGVPVIWNPRTVYLDGNWLDQNPAYIDFILIHEMTHVLQRYKWLKAPKYWVEGIASYVPCKLGFGQGKLAPTTTFGSPNYLSGYNSTAAFLLYLEEKYGPQVIRDLHGALRGGKKTTPIFESATGKSLEHLWKDFCESPRYSESAKIVDNLRSKLGLTGTESPRTERKRFDLFLRRHFDPETAATIRTELEYREGRAPPDVVRKFARTIFSQSSSGKVAWSLEKHVNDRLKANTLPWMNKDEISAARDAGRMPWVARRGQKEIWFEMSDGPGWSADSYPVTIPLVGTNSGQALFYHYEFVLASPRAKWRLKRAWIAEPDGTVVEEFARTRGTR